jgi:hypothetical protein
VRRPDADLLKQDPTLSLLACHQHAAKGEPSTTAWSARQEALHLSGDQPLGFICGVHPLRCWRWVRGRF